VLYEGEKKKTIREEERERNEWGRVSAPQERMGEDRLTHDSVSSLNDRYPHVAGLRIGSGLKWKIHYQGVIIDMTFSEYSSRMNRGKTKKH
jgi:hypothetical protein